MAEANKLGVSYWSLVEPAWKSLNGSWDAGPTGFLHQFRAARPEVGLESTCRQITGLRCPDFLVPAAWPRLGPIPPARLGRAA